MTDPQSPLSTGHDSTGHDSTGRQPDVGPQPPATPRWVKITGAVVALLVVAFLVKVLFGGGVSHGPGMHGGLGTPPSATVVGATALALPGL